MAQSASLSAPVAPAGMHVGIIMDGNGRWARARGRPRAAGHLAGVNTVQKITEHASTLGVGTLTLYAFSADNWRRPAAEVSALMRLFRRALDSEIKRCLANGVRMFIIGRRDRLSATLLRTIDRAESATMHCRTLWLRIAIDYSSRDAIMRAAARYAALHPGGTAPVPGSAEFAALITEVHHSAPTPDVDLLIRTGGEQRLSDFLLWECSYAELYFTASMWPEFGTTEFSHAVNEFRRRERRFGGLVDAAAG
jgi:undecaprenyl diphosphate synthase